MQGSQPSETPWQHPSIASLLSAVGKEKLRLRRTMQVQAIQSTVFGLAIAVPGMFTKERVVGISPGAPPSSYALPQGHFHRVSQPSLL